MKVEIGHARLVAGVMSGILLLAGLGCGPSKPASDIKHYTLTGKIISIDKANLSMVVDAGEIKGFMGAMAMAYKVKNADDLKPVGVGDTMTADLIVKEPDYWLENVKVTQKGTAAPPAQSEFHMPSRGEEVPDFKLVDQDSRHISLHQFKGKALILTFIYTRCPFADFCPRVTGEFAKLNEQLEKNPLLYGKTHLLSISFDPDHDTPKVLRDYGLHWAGKPSSFAHWEFGVASKSELPELEKFFGLTVEPEQQGMITHSLSTAVITPNGKIWKWYHGSDWQASDLAGDVASAIAPPS